MIQIILTIQNYRNSVNYEVIRNIKSGAKHLLTLTSVYKNMNSIYERRINMSAPMKNSRQRNAILECVMSHHDHPTADIIYQELRESFPNISLGTVYRNLSLLTSSGSFHLNKKRRLLENPHSHQL